MILAIFFIFGLIVGSFLNVVVYRLKMAESLVFGGSKCPKCKHEIRWYDNIPLISFVLLKFRCRDCGEKISWQYPLVEFLTGVIFVLVGNYFFVLENMSTWVDTFYYLAIASILAVVLIYDFLYMEIPLILIWVGIVLAIIFDIFSSSAFSQISLSNFWEIKIISGLIASLLAWLFFFSLSYGSKGKWMGMGDAYLAILLGLILGVPNIFYALVIGFTFGAVLGMVLVLKKKKKMKSQLPLAPFLITGTFIMIFWGEKIIEWHLNLFY